MATARSIAFIALQCFQCSTMQVKQQKRSSNKWTCVVCNEKQSVLKVFARSHVAKDVRGFVQSFNMSRRFSDSLVPATATATAPPQSETEGSGGATGRKAKSIDWTEYLVAGEDEDGPGVCGTVSEDEREATMIVTELPDGLFKRAKLNTSAFKPGFPKGSGRSSNFNKPQLYESNAKSVVSSVQRSKKVLSDTSLFQTSMGRRDQSEAGEDAGPRKVQMTGARRESRWSSYMTEEDGEFLSGVSRDTSQSKFMNETGPFVCDLLETATPDQAVEDDIHPDFI